MLAQKRPLTRSRRCEKNRDGLLAVHQATLLSLPKSCVMPMRRNRNRAKPAKSASHLPEGSGRKQAAI